MDRGKGSTRTMWFLRGKYWDTGSLSLEPSCLEEARKGGGSGGYQEDLIGLVTHESPFASPHSE